MKKKYFIIGGITILILIIVLFVLFRFKISKNEAFNIAYKYLDKTQSDFSYSKIENDFSDNCYEIYLNDGTYKYELDINMTNGKVINFEKRSINTINNTTNENYISVEEAKRISLEHAKLNNNEVIFNNINMELEDGIMVYDIEFFYDRYEYEYEIDAKNGNIVKFDKDKE